MPKTEKEIEELWRVCEAKKVVWEQTTNKFLKMFKSKPAEDDEEFQEVCLENASASYEYQQAMIAFNKAAGGPQFEALPPPPKTWEEFQEWPVEPNQEAEQWVEALMKGRQH